MSEFQRMRHNLFCVKNTPAGSRTRFYSTNVVIIYVTESQLYSSSRMPTTLRNYHTAVHQNPLPRILLILDFIFEFLEALFLLNLSLFFLLLFFHNTRRIRTNKNTHFFFNFSLNLPLVERGIYNLDCWTGMEGLDENKSFSYE